MPGKVLIITYYWPPSGGAGVQRWLKFVKYLRLYGWEPVVYTPENPEPPAFDVSLFKDIPEGLTVIKQPIWEPYRFYRKVIGAGKNERINAGFLSEKKAPGLAQKFSIWLRGNFFIPDARKFWIKPSIKFLTEYLKCHPVDAIISTGPPHSMHMIALGVKKNTGLPWLADFRDPWTHIDFYNQLMLSSFADRVHHKMEQQVIHAADKLVTVSSSWETDFKQLGAHNTAVITNGFDSDDFPESTVQKPDNFILTHIGSLNKDRNPEFLWKVIGELVRSNELLKSQLHIRFIGKTDISVFESLERNQLLDFTEKIEYVPHDTALKLSSESAVLLLLINNTPNVMGIIPGKVFEYLASHRPILCIGPPDGDSASIVKEANAGPIVDFNDEDSIRNAILDLFSKYLTEDAYTDRHSIDKYSRKNLTKDIAELLNEMMINKKKK